MRDVMVGSANCGSLQVVPRGLTMSELSRNARVTSHYHRREPILLHERCFQDLWICFRESRDCFWDEPVHSGNREIPSRNWVATSGVIVNCFSDLRSPV